MGLLPPYYVGLAVGSGLGFVTIYIYIYIYIYIFFLKFEGVPNFVIEGVPNLA